MKSSSSRPVQPNGLVEDRPSCSRWEPEEVQQVARIQIQGLLKHLDPAELVRAAIIYSECPLPAALQVIEELDKADSDRGIEKRIHMTGFPCKADIRAGGRWEPSTMNHTDNSADVTCRGCLKALKKQRGDDQ